MEVKQWMLNIVQIYHFCGHVIKHRIYCPVYTVQNYPDRHLDRYLHRDPEDAPVNMGHSLFNITKIVILLFIVQSLLHRTPPNIWIKIIQIAIQIECLHRIKILDPECDLDYDPDNFAPCKWGICCHYSIIYHTDIN